MKRTKPATQFQPVGAIRQDEILSPQDIQASDPLLVPSQGFLNCGCEFSHVVASFPMWVRVFNLHIPSIRFKHQKNPPGPAIADPGGLLSKIERRVHVATTHYFVSFASASIIGVTTGPRSSFTPGIAITTSITFCKLPRLSVTSVPTDVRPSAVSFSVAS